MTMKRPLDCNDAVFSTSMNKTTLVWSNLTFFHTVLIFNVSWQIMIMVSTVTELARGL